MGQKSTVNECHIREDGNTFKGMRVAGEVSFVVDLHRRSG